MPSKRTSLLLMSDRKVRSSHRVTSFNGEYLGLRNYKWSHLSGCNSLHVR